jgi:hypothetical protein
MKKKQKRENKRKNEKETNTGPAHRCLGCSAARTGRPGRDKGPPGIGFLLVSALPGRLDLCDNVVSLSPIPSSTYEKNPSPHLSTMSSTVLRSAGRSFGRSISRVLEEREVFLPRSLGRTPRLFSSNGFGRDGPIEVMFPSSSRSLSSRSTYL